MYTEHHDRQHRTKQMNHMDEIRATGEQMKGKLLLG